MISLRDYMEKVSGDGKKHIIAELDVDTAAELPSQDWSGYFLEMGSIAHDISTGDFYCIDSEGTWYNQDGTGAYSDNVEQAALNLSPNLNISGADSPSVLPRDLEEEVTGNDELLRDTESR